MKNMINNMKKIFKYSVLCVLSLFVFAACEIGLGAAVDLEAPVVTLTSHKDNDSVAQTFRLIGTASDNEGVTKLSIDFEDADIHYTVEPGKKWQKKTHSKDWADVADDKASFELKDGVWNWYVDVNAAEAKEGTGSNYTLEIVVEDALGNASKDSKINCSLIVDYKIPNVSIYKPDIISTHDKAEQNFTAYDSINGNTFLNLLNGAITFYGRQDGSASFRELRIELDDGTTDDSIISDNAPVIKEPTTEKIAQAYQFGSANRYYSKTLIRNNTDVMDLRNWELTIIPKEWITAAHPELATGKHLIRIITTSISNSDAWERKVIGYFVWWPEADTPWVTANDGAEDDASPVEIYPSAIISGIAYDDDGISSLSYTFEKKSDSGDYSVFEGLSDKSLALSEENAKSSAWSVKAPSDEGVYRLTLKIKDINGTQGQNLVRYFKTMDIQPPAIEIDVNSNALANASGNISFTGNASDDGKVKSLKVIFLNPSLNDNPQNANMYVGGKEAFWDSNDKATDANGNKLFVITLGSPTYDNITKVNTYEYSKTLNLFTDLNIGIGDGKRPLESLNFIFRAVDNGNDGGAATVEQVTLSGDTEAPVLTVDSIQQFTSTGSQKTGVLPFSGEVPNLAVVQDGDYVILKGTWSDNSVKAWNYDSSKIGNVAFTWGSAVFTRQKLQKQNDGSFYWEYKVTGIPKKATPITASIKDYGWNTTTVTKSVFIETTSLELERVGALTDDGIYKAGTEIQLFLEFTKNTNVTGTPKLKLDTGAGATRYAAFDASTNNKAQLVFKYTVQPGDNIANLDVTEIEGGTWKDATVEGGETFTPHLPTDINKLLGTSRNITLDTTAPTVSRIEALSPAGDYKEDAKILLKLSFSEKVTITNASNLSFGLAGITSPALEADLSGSDVIFTYTVGASDNASTLKFTANSISKEGVTVTDDAGNSITNAGWELAETTFAGIKVDTNSPFPPTVNASWTGNDIVILDEAGANFTLSGETDATIEYSIDNGSSWQTYRSKVTLANNGVFKILARQTDKAGNLSSNSTLKTITIDKGALFTNVTVTNPSGKYKTGTVITGKINFRKEVALPANSTISLNVKRSGSDLPAISIDNCTTKASSFTFTYTVEANDVIDTTNNTNGYLKVKNWSFTTVTVDYGTNGTKSVASTYAGVFTSTKDIPASKEIQIMTGYPAYTGATLSADNKTITITFDRAISKVSSTKNIVLEMTDSFKAPAVLTESQYNDFASAIDGLDAYYTAGVNGATTSGNNLVPDTTTKYILNYGTEDTNATLVGKFTTANKHKVIVPLYSSNVRASGSSLIVNLTGSYAIPVKGATYKLTVPAGVVQDEVQNQNNVESTKTGIVASGVESPFIRIQKSDQVITSTGSAQTATVTMPDTAKMKINCQTPGATITFAKTEQTSTQITIKDCKTHTASALKTADVTYPTTGFDTYSTEQTLGAAIANYTGATGLKIAIAARATKGGTTVTSYEYAARSVLKFNLSTTQRWNNRDRAWNSRDYDIGGGYATANTYEGEKALCDLPIWVQGGDAPAGGNVIAGFPLAWDDCSTYKLMKCDSSYKKSAYGNGGNVTNTDSNAAQEETAYSTEGTWKEMHTYWYWVTWDLSSVCYTGFAVGDVPADASTANGKKGPKNWYVGECSWAAIKQNTALYPGETLELSLDGVSNTDDNNNTRGTYLFRTKNKGYRD